MLSKTTSGLVPFVSSVERAAGVDAEDDVQVDVDGHGELALELGVSAELVERDIEAAVARERLRQVQLDARHRVVAVVESHCRRPRAPRAPPSARRSW